MVSLCIPAYQAEQFLAETLASVFAQNYADMEVIVLDNNSSDRTSGILAQATDPRLRVERNTDTLPLPENWNRVVELCRGEFVKIVCADDLITTDCIARQALILQENQGVALVACRTDLVDESGHPLRRDTGLRRLIGRHSGSAVVRQVIRSGGNPVGPTAAVMFRRKDFVEVGGFDGDLLFPMELDLWTRLAGRGDFVGERVTGASFRVSGSSATAGTSGWSQLVQQVKLTQKIKRRRAWPISISDRAVGWINTATMQARRTLLFIRAANRTATSVDRQPGG